MDFKMRAYRKSYCAPLSRSPWVVGPLHLLKVLPKTDEPQLLSSLVPYRTSWYASLVCCGHDRNSSVLVCAVTRLIKLGGLLLCGLGSFVNLTPHALRKLCSFFVTCHFCIVIAVTMSSGCTHVIRRFPLNEPLWEDPDRNHVPVKPAEYYSGLYADAVNKTIFRPVSEFFAFRKAGDAINVNSIDEVPNSSWFQNRFGYFSMTPEEVAQGACIKGPTLDPSKGPWIITAAKTDGVTPGFYIKAPDGQKYLLKFDGIFRPERNSSADVIGSKIYYAAGYFAPCNQVVYFNRQILRLLPDATTKDDRGRKQPFKQADMEMVLLHAVHSEDGRLRGMASRFLSGIPLGPYPTEGVRRDDPNDVIPHEHRRELRAALLIDAWLDHFDAREPNSLDMWVKEGGRNFIRHYQLDFGDSLGSPWLDDRLNQRVGHVYYLDIPQVAADLFTLGLLPRPWFRSKNKNREDIFGQYGWHDFVPSKWKPIYPNPPYSNITWRDALWITRIIARFTDAHVQAMVKETKLSSPQAEKYLTRALIERRNRIVEEYLGKYVPLDRFQLIRHSSDTGGKRQQSLCFEDLAIRYARVNPKKVVYRMRMMAGIKLDQTVGWQYFQPEISHPFLTCVNLPLSNIRPADLAPSWADDNDPRRYGVLTIHVQQIPSLPPTSIRIHFYDLGPERGFVIVGLERPDKTDPQAMNQVMERTLPWQTRHVSPGL